MTVPVLELRGASRTHGTGETAVHALRGVDLVVQPGELVAVMGAVGSGKSTLLTLAGGLDAATCGEVLVEGVPLSGLDAAGLAALRRRSVGYVFQDLNLLPALTAVGERGPAARARRACAPATPGARAARARRGRPRRPRPARFPDELSGGEQQRVAIARALVGDRRLVLADEPTGALDSVTGEAVLALLRARVDAGAAGVLVTHEARHAGWADRVVFLRDGAVVDEHPRPGVGRVTGRSTGRREPAAVAGRLAAGAADRPARAAAGQGRTALVAGHGAAAGDRRRRRSTRCCAPATSARSRGCRASWAPRRPGSTPRYGGGGAADARPAASTLRRRRRRDPTRAELPAALPAGAGCCACGRGSGAGCAPPDGR